MQPALGVTEPGAIAFAVATAKRYISGKLLGIRLELNSGMYKNAFTCGIPGTEHTGFLWAAALGYTAGDASLGLEALRALDASGITAAQELIDCGKIEAVMAEITPNIFICITVRTECDECCITIEDSHTNITSVLLNGKECFAKEYSTVLGDSSVSEIHRHSFSEIIQYVSSVPIEEISFIRTAFSMNLSLLQAGLMNDRAAIARHLFNKNGQKLLSDDKLLSAQLLCAGAIEARVLGIDKPAMSITGSGSHGIIATMPLYAIAHGTSSGEEKLLRSAALSVLITQYIKEYSGKLSAMCGCGVAAGSGMACALTMLKGGNVRQIEATLRNMALSITGMICDGGNHGCALKAITATDAAFRASELALSGIELSGEHGISGYTPEETMRYMGYISSPGMLKTECAIIDILQQKNS